MVEAQKKRVTAVEGFRYTSAIKKLRKLTKRLRIVPGGTSAGKTFGILPLLIDRAIKSPGLAVSVVSESIPHLKKGAIKDFIKIMKATGRWVEGRYNKTDRVYTFANGSFIEFFSADSEGRVRGPRRNVLYINECNNLAFDTYYQLAIRTDGEIWLDYNPSNEFWVHVELIDDPDAEVLRLTYQDNEALPASIVKEIEKNRAKAFFDETLEGEALYAEANIKSSYWANWWKVYGEGRLGSLEGVIFSNWRQVPSVPEGAKLLGYGQDFGFTADPAATVAVYEYDGKIILDELIYARGLINAELVKAYKRAGVKPSLPIWADKAEPKSIKEISGYGYRIAGADKGPDSVNFGIDLLQSYEMLVTSSSVNLIAELRSYIWEKDKKTGQNTNAPEDANNHAIDAVRYLAVMMLTKYQPSYKSRTYGKTKQKITRGEFYKDLL
jgi:phage terminase large subunit